MPYRSSGGASESSTQAWRLRKREMILIVGFWTFLAVLTVANRLLDPRGPGLQGGFSWSPVTLGFFENYLWAAITPGVFWLSSRFAIERSKWLRRITLFLGAGLLVALFVDVAVDLFRVHALNVPLRRAPGVSPIQSISRLWFLDDLMVYLAVLAAGFAREYFLRYQLRKGEAIRLQAQAAQLQAQLAEARLTALRMQINPHFLFNTLHAISTLVERDPRGVRRMVARLSELLRHTLDGSSDQEVPLEEELEFLRKYLDIMQVRFQGKLEITLSADPSILRALVPNLILQPLVENAIKHGVGNLIGTGRIEVRAKKEGDRLRLTVRDNGPGLQGTGTGPIEEGVGLRNTRQRLEQLYGDEQSLSLGPADGGGVQAEIWLPFHTPADLRAMAVAEPAGSVVYDV